MQINTSHKCVDGVSAVSEASYRIDADATVHISRLLRNMYSEPIKAVMREYVANAVDACVQIGSKAPVVVQLPTMLEPTFSVTDSGTGLSVEDFDKHILGYGSSGSHKRVSENQIGGMGIGCKSMFAVTDSFTYEVWHGGEERKYLCYLDDSDLGKSKLLYRKPTTHPNGMRVSAPIKADSVQAFHQSAPFALSFFKHPLKVTPKPEYTPAFEVPVILQSVVPFKVDGRDVSWRLIDLNSAPWLKPKSHYRGSALLVCMGGVAYSVNDPGIDQLVYNLPSELLLLDAAINTFEIAPTRETLQSTRKVVRDLTTILKGMPDAFRSAMQPQIDAEPTVAKAYRKMYDIENVLDTTRNMFLFKYKGVSYDLFNVFGIAFSDVVSYGVHTLGRYWSRGANGKIKLTAIGNEEYLHRYTGTKPGEFTGLLPGAERLKCNTLVVKGVNYVFSSMAQRGYELYLGELPDPKHTPKFLCQTERSNNCGEILWIRGDHATLTAKHPWILELATKTVDLSQETWKPEAIVRTPRTSSGVRRPKTMPAGVYQFQTEGNIGCASAAWRLAEVTVETAPDTMYYVLMDKFEPVDPEGHVTKGGCGSWNSTISDYRAFMEVVQLHFPGTELFGIKSQESDRIAKLTTAGFSPVPFSALYEKTVKFLLSPEQIETRHNLFSAVLHEAATDHRRIGWTEVLGQVYRLKGTKDHLVRMALLLRSITQIPTLEKAAKNLNGKYASLRESILAYTKLLRTKSFLGRDADLSLGQSGSAWASRVQTTILNNDVEGHEWMKDVVVNGKAWSERGAWPKTTDGRQLGLSKAMTMCLLDYVKPLCDKLEDPKLALVIMTICNEKALRTAAINVGVTTYERDVVGYSGDEWLLEMVLGALEQSSEVGVTNKKETA